MGCTNAVYTNTRHCTEEIATVAGSSREGGGEHDLDCECVFFLHWCAASHIWVEKIVRSETGRTGLVWELLFPPLPQCSAAGVGT